MNEEFLAGLGLSEEQSAGVLKEYMSERLKGEFNAAGVCDMAAAEALLDREGMTPDNLPERVADLKRAHPRLFFDRNAPRIVRPAEKGGVAKSDFAKMGYAERLKLFSADPALYKKLV